MHNQWLTKFLFMAGIALTATATFAVAGDGPENLGYHRIQDQEEMAVALLAQRVLIGVATHDPYLFAGLVAEDYLETAINELSSQREEPVGHKACLKTTPGNGEMITKLASQKIFIQNDEARCALTWELDSGLSGAAQLSFIKKGNRWLLAKSQGLSQLMSYSVKSDNALLTKTAANAREYLLETSETVANTFIAQPLSPQHGITTLSRQTTQSRLQRRLFEMPYGSALFAQVQELKTAPFLAATYVQMVTDPAWNRIIYGDYQKWIKAYEGVDAGTPLRQPHGIAVDPQGKVYVADTGNRRVIVLKLVGPPENLTLVYSGTIGAQELSQPTDLAWDDRGTIFDVSDDVLWVIDRGAAALLAYRTIAASAPLLRYQSETLVDLSAVAIGRFAGQSDGNIYLADAATRKIQRLYFDGQALTEVASFEGEAEMVPAALSTDYWGNVYLSDSALRKVHKLSPALAPLATRASDDANFQPERFQPLFGSLVLAGSSQPLWSGYDQSFLLERWSENSGGRRYELGIDFQIESLRLTEDLSGLLLAGKLTDAGHVKTGLVAIDGDADVSTLIEAWHLAGEIQTRYDRRMHSGEMIPPGHYKLRHTLTSTYDKPASVRESEAFYLPLYYYEDCGADDTHLVRGTRMTQFGTEAERSITTDAHAVVYRFTDLNPGLKYEARAGYFSGEGAVEQALFAGQNALHTALTISANSHTTDWLEIPTPAFADGVLELRVVKTGGTGPASVAELWLREAHFDVNNPPARDLPAAQIPQEFTLEQNYPNPFNPSTTITFNLPEGFHGRVTLRLYNMLGERVRELIGAELPAGTHREVWNGLDDSGQRLATGVYLYQLRAGSFSATRKLVLMK